VTGIKALTSTTGVEVFVVNIAWLLQDVAGAADALTSARSVMIVPGYGLAVAGAQYAIAGAGVSSIPTRHGHQIANRCTQQGVLLCCRALASST